MTFGIEPLNPPLEPVTESAPPYISFPFQPLLGMRSSNFSLVGKVACTRQYSGAVAVAATTISPLTAAPVMVLPPKSVQAKATGPESSLPPQAASAATTANATDVLMLFTADDN